MTPMLSHSRGLGNTLKAKRQADHYDPDEPHGLIPGLTMGEFMAGKEREAAAEAAYWTPQRRQEAAERSHRWQEAEDERYKVDIDQIYPVPRHWTNDRARARFYHFDLMDMDPTQLAAELDALRRRVWRSSRNNPVTGTGHYHADPQLPWLKEREARLLAALRGELPPGACSHCGGQPLRRLAPDQPRQLAERRAPRVGLRFEGGSS